jgi:hypothetical protein
VSDRVRVVLCLTLGGKAVDKLTGGVWGRDGALNVLREAQLRGGFAGAGGRWLEEAVVPDVRVRRADGGCGGVGGSRAWCWGGGWRLCTG